MHSPESLLWLQASLVPDWGPAKLRQLLDSPQKKRDLFKSLPNRVPASCRPEIAACEAWSAVSGNYILGLTDDLYPPLLLQIPDPPPVLFARGAIETLSLPQIALVGSRKPSPEGRRNARWFAEELSACGYVVTSGLALGIDGECHKAVVGRHGKTIGVLGSGPDRLYPKSHSVLAEEILAMQGTLVSEFMPGSPPLPVNFPRRNRIISGLAHGVIVVEAAMRSGSLITARLAAEQGREVFSIPGSIRNPQTRGCHELIRRGAKLVESTADVMEELPGILAWEASRCVSTGKPPGDPAKDELSGEAKQLLQNLGQDPLTVDELALQTGLGTRQVATTLVMLEVAGQVEQHEGRFVLSGR
jgi:DNA processing protein